MISILVSLKRHSLVPKYQPKLQKIVCSTLIVIYRSTFSFDLIDFEAIKVKLNGDCGISIIFRSNQLIQITQYFFNHY